jgi:formate-dependent nitrite reductase membrane component NrfD
MLSLAVLVAVYVLFHYRYVPADIGASLFHTLLHLLSVSPVVIGLTILVVTFLQRMHGARLPWDRIIRIYLTFGIIAGFLVALGEYWDRGAKGLQP